MKHLNGGKYKGTYVDDPRCNIISQNDSFINHNCHYLKQYEKEKKRFFSKECLAIFIAFLVLFQFRRRIFSDLKVLSLSVRGFRISITLKIIYNVDLVILFLFRRRYSFVLWTWYPCIQFYFHSLVLILLNLTIFTFTCNPICNKKKLINLIIFILLFSFTDSPHIREVRCYCNQPECVPQGYMCRGKGCFTELPSNANPSLLRAEHNAYSGCLDENFKERQCPTGYLCCEQDLCNHVDSPAMRNRLNKTLQG